jgi:hypothetical protein
MDSLWTAWFWRLYRKKNMAQLRRWRVKCHTSHPSEYGSYIHTRKAHSDP